MSQDPEALKKLGYSDCFYQEGQFWGFWKNDAMPMPIPEDVLRAVGLHSPRQRLMSRAQIWYDRHGLRRQTHEL